MKTYGLFIDNEWRESKQRFASVNPATGAALAEFASAGANDVDAAVKAARAAFASGPWPGLPAAERGRVLLRAAEVLRRRAAEFAEAETRDVGKPIFESRNVDVPIAIDSLEYYGCLVRGVNGAAIPVGGAALDYTLREPVGVVAAVTPWNFPLVLACRKLGPALAAGNTVVLKPASWTPLTTILLGEVFKEAGLPAGVLNIVTGAGSVAGRALVAHPGVDKLSFTGSTEIGRDVLAASAKGICACSLELGGKSPAVVLADADLDQAAAGILFGAFLNQGECCCAATRVLVDRTVHAALAAKLSAGCGGIRVGDPMDEATRMGPLVAAAHRDTVRGFIRAGEQDGSRKLCGGGVPAGLSAGFYLEPTLFDDVPTTSRLYREEVFGPVLPITAFDGEEALLAAANDTPYGLAASLWTRDVAKGQRLAPRIRAGTVWINMHNFVFNNAPYGGYKQSGLGRECGPEGLEAYTEIKNVMTWIAPNAFTWY